MNIKVKERNKVFVINSENKILAFVRESRNALLISFPEVRSDSEIPFLKQTSLEEFEYIDKYSKEEINYKTVNGHVIKIPKRVNYNYYAISHDLTPDDTRGIMELTGKNGKDPYFLTIDEIKECMSENYYLNYMNGKESQVEDRLKPILELERKMLLTSTSEKRLERKDKNVRN